MDTTSVETAASARPTSGTAAATSKDTPDPSSSTTGTTEHVQDIKNDTSGNTSASQPATEPASQKDQVQEKASEQTPQSFAAAVFPGFNPPKLNTSAFFSSMQGKIQSTIANTKPPALNIQAPHLEKVDFKQIQASTEQLANTTKDWGFSAFKSLSSAAQRVGANVTQGIQKEHDDFVRQKKLETVAPREGTEILPAWAGMPDEDKIKARILSLSKDKRNFLLPPPPGTDFVFDMNVYSTTAFATLKQDPNLNRMRFSLVPKEIEELVFWRNYFYRVSLLKQFALAAASGGTDSLADLASDSTTTENGAENGGAGSDHRRSLSVSSALGYNIYFGGDDVDGPPRRSRPNSMVARSNAKDASAASASAPTTAATRNTGKSAVKDTERKSEVLFEAEMPDHDEDPDAWLEKQLASGVSIGGEDDADVDVGDWEKELQNELKDYVEGS
ncbi:hypothetical protein BC939DRAFT_473417 [Gamsiella multidivaricata]|uniref:uncharacterized protein n=1 Tax=Gamsiella multidivaricata TaxID=101098 RepID=UPI002220D592|nr:uncharacterized protein BC939DRAFT_473417 [Gamsiella multidivaricata]KAG0367844.1 hypothetical protein BGZ54_003143 [Gamsiella multidivaricata]KAI7830588.1 hypothetical protein BC939DRAFT_473417 [Gamsiella multidivaricata]